MHYPFDKELSELEYENLNEFFQSSTPEGLFVEYKSDIPTKLSKNIAAFANTSGGYIFIGVKENDETKAPESWDGIPNANNLSERINQFIGGVRPFPECDFKIIDIPKSQKKLVVIQVNEGFDTPYFRNSDLSVWVRTGDVSTQINQADRETLRYLIEKNNTAHSQQEAKLKNSNAIYFGRMRKTAHTHNDVVAQDIQDMINTPLLSVTIQPYGNTNICESSELKSRITDYRITRGSSFGDLPALHSEPTENGIASAIDDSFVSRHYRPRHYYLSKYGLVNVRRNIKKAHDGIDYIYLPIITYVLKDVLGTSSNLYKLFRHNGSLKLTIELHNIEGLPLASSFDLGDFDTIRNADGSDFDWTFSTTTMDILNTEKRLALMQNTISQIFWDLGYEHVSRSAQPD